jgi:subtilisin
MSYRKLLRIYGIFCVFGVFIISYASAETQKKYIVVFKDHPKKREMLKKPKFTSAKSFNIIPAMATELDSENLKELQKDQDVAYIEQDYPVYATDITTAGEESVSIAAETSSQDIPYGVELIGATQVWSKTKGAGAIVAILDTGISMYHPDRGNVIASSSFVTNETVEDLDGHGTHTSIDRQSTRQ